MTRFLKDSGVQEDPMDYKNLNMIGVNVSKVKELDSTHALVLTTI